MTRLLPRSLLGQVMLALAAALLIAQAISAVMLYRAASERREFALASAASFQLLAGQRRDLRGERRASGPPRPVTRRIPGAERGLRLPRRIRFTETAAAPLLPGESRNSAREATIAQQLERHGLAVAEVVATERAVSADPLIAQSAADSPEWRERLRPRLSSTNLIAQMRATQAGNGLCILPDFMAGHDPDLVPVLPAEVELKRSFWLVAHEDSRESARVRTVMRFVADKVDEARGDFMNFHSEHPD